MSEDDSETLRERVRELEQTAADLRETVAELQQRRGPSRRDLLKVGSGGLLGAGLLASSQPVSAAPASSDTSAGQVGVAGDSTDVVLDQLRDPGGDEILNVDDSGGINAQFGRPWHFDSLDVDKAGLGNDPGVDSTETFIDYNIGFRATQTVHRQTNVSDVAKRIYTCQEGTNAAAIIYVHGFDNNQGDAFFDLIVTNRSMGSVSQLHTVNIRGSPTARSYSKSSFSNDVNLTMNSSDSFNTLAIGREMLAQ